MNKRFYIVFLFAVLSVHIFAQIPDQPKPARLVNDFAGLFTPQQQAQLEQFLVMVDDSTSNQIAVVTVNDLGGYDKAQFATELGQKWKVGNEKFDNGIVFLIKPKKGNQSGEVFIAVGYGLESAIPDATTKRIIEQITIPYFKQNDYFNGTAATVDYLYKIAKGEINVSKEKERGNLLGYIILGIVLFVIILLSSRSNNKPNKNNRHTTYGSAGLPWLLMGSGRGGIGGSSSGGSSLGGFGGGSFGGGGAGGSW